MCLLPNDRSPRPLGGSVSEARFDLVTRSNRTTIKPEIEKVNQRHASPGTRTPASSDSDGFPWKSVIYALFARHTFWIGGMWVAPDHRDANSGRRWHRRVPGSFTVRVRPVFAPWEGSGELRQG